MYIAHTCTRVDWVYIYACMYVRALMGVCECVGMRAYVHVGTCCVCSCVTEYMHACVHDRVNACVHVYLFVCMCMYQ